ncbi:transporter substrate-binding domain-containing protein [Candidatus Bipolaricaulota bacterium]|nr:transporter substrate-binding domain-containing protein [Candidatus Bipolaricaulota bacterium]
MLKVSIVSVVCLSLLLSIGSAVGSAEPYVVVTDAPWAPFEMVDNDGDFFGFDIDLIRAVAVTAGFSVEVKNVAFDAIVEMIRTGGADIGASGLTITEDRAKTVDFSVPYYQSNQAVVVASNSGLNLVTALTGGSVVGAQNATSGLWWAEDNLTAAGIDIDLRGYETYPAAILDLVSGRLDAVIQDEPASQASLAAYPDDLSIAGLIYTQEQFGFIVKKGDAAGLLPKIEETLASLGLTVEETTWETMLVVEPGSFVDALLAIYFGPDLDDIATAWDLSKGLLLTGDLSGYTQSMKSQLGL